MAYFISPSQVAFLTKPTTLATQGLHKNMTIGNTIGNAIGNSKGNSIQKTMFYKWLEQNKILVRGTPNHHRNISG